MLYGLRCILGSRLRRRGGREGEDAIQKAQAQVLHGILMDMKMTGMRSVEAYRDIRPLAPTPVSSL
jgi:CheY-like chemotaxis protein